MIFLLPSPMSHLYSLAQSHVVPQQCPLPCLVVLVQEPDSITLVATQVLVYSCWNLQHKYEII